MKKKVIYYNHNNPQSYFPHINEHALAVSIDIDKWYLEAKENEPSYKFSGNTYCGFVNKEIYKLWSDLPIDSGGLIPFDTYEETFLLSEALFTASNRLDIYIKNMRTDINEDVKWAHSDDTEYRIIIDDLELKNGLIKLSKFLNESANRPNNSVEFWL